MSKKGISRRTLFGSTALMAGANLLIPSAAAKSSQTAARRFRRSGILRRMSS